MKSYFTKWSLLLLSCLFSFQLWAQVTQSGLSGTIRDSEKETIPGVVIKVTHTPSGTQYHTATQANGTYFIQGMRSGGPYKVELNYLGLQPVIIEDVYLTLGETFILNQVMDQVENYALEAITITSSNILNSERTGAATNVSRANIEKIPTISRSIQDLTKLSPQANGNNFAGRDGRYNNLQIDGAYFNNGFGLSSNPLPGGGNQPISMDAIEEVQINVAPYDVRQTGFTGAGINAITRSGTNKFEGSAYSFQRPQSFTGLQVGDQKLSKEVQTSSQIYGARAGGALVKNKLFIFGNFEYETAQTAGNTWLAARPGLTGPNVTRVQASDLEAVSNHLINQYGYNPGRYEGYANQYLNENIKGLLRLDWNINEQHQLSLRYNQMHGTSQQGTNNNSGPNPRSSASRISSESMAFENANYALSNKVMAITAELNSHFSSKASNQFLATFSSINDSRSTPGDLFPFVDIWEDGKNYMSFGTELFSYNNDVVNNNLSITNNFNYFTGKHHITAGASFQSLSFKNSYVRLGTSYYRYDSVEDFLNDARPSSYGVTYPFAGQDGYAKVNFGLAGLYLQDQITVTDLLRITAGIRLDMPLFLNQPPSNPAVEQIELLDPNGQPTYYTTAQWPKSSVLFSPRIGVNFDPFGDRTLQLRGGTGIFTGNIPFVWFTNMPTNAGVLQNTYEPVDSETLDLIDHFNPDPMYWPNHLPNQFTKQPGSEAPGSVALIDPNFKMPQIWRTNFGMDYSIPNTKLTATLDVIYSKDINGIYQFNANRKLATQQLQNGGDHRDFWNGRNNAVYNDEVGPIVPVLSNTNKGWSLSSSLGLNLSNWNGWTGSVFYTYTAAKDITGNPGSAAGSAWSNNYSINDPNELLLGYSQFSVPHRVMANIGYEFNFSNHFKTTLAVFYSGAHQGRFTYTYGGDINADGVSLDLLYLPSNSDEINFVDIVQDGAVLFNAAEQRAAYDLFIANNNNLSDYKDEYIDRNSGLLPWLNRFDFRILQDIYTGMGKNKRNHTLQLSVDLLNVGNLLSKNWGLYKELNGGSDFNYSLLNVRSVDSDGVPSFNMATIKNEAGQTILADQPFRNRFSTSSTWGLQIGLRYIF